MRWNHYGFLGVVMGAGLLAAVCGSAAPSVGPEATDDDVAETPVARESVPADSDQAAEPAADDAVVEQASDEAADAASGADAAAVPAAETASGTDSEGGAAAPSEERASDGLGPNALFLDPEIDTTPAGDAITRGPALDIPFLAASWATRWDVRIVNLSEVLSGGPPRDGIPSIDNPRFVTVADADAILDDNSPVVQIEVNGDQRAYPLEILTWHEIVNDVVGGVPVAVTFCPLCNTAIAYDRRLRDETVEFGVSGLLRNSDLIMYDRTTESLWQQIGGKAIVGSMVGARLTPLPASIVAWAQFRDNFPDGLVLSRETGFSRSYGRNPYSGYDDVNNTPFLFRGQIDGQLSAFERVVTLDLEGTAVAYPFTILADVRVIQETRGGRDLVVFWTPGAVSALDESEINASREVGATGVFVPAADGQALTFAPSPDDEQTFVDQETGSRWNIFGEAVAGPLAGAQLEPVVHANHFWFAWAAFQPDTEVYPG